MTRNEVINKAEELKEVCKEAHNLDRTFYEECLKDYAVQVWALKSIGDNYPWEQVLEIQEEHDDLSQALPWISDKKFEEYIVLGDLLAVLSKKV